MRVFLFPEDLCSRLEDEEVQATDESAMRKGEKGKKRKSKN